MSLVKFEKKITTPSPSNGADQLGREVGTPLPGDVVKLHGTASYESNRPLFKIGSKNFGANKLRKTEFLSTHIVGETGFIQAKISSSPTKAPTSAADVLAQCVQTMMLGESAQFILDFASMDSTTQDLFCNTKIHKGHYKSIPRDAEKLVFELDLFRVGRDETEHFRTKRNSSAPVGAFAM